MKKNSTRLPKFYNTCLLRHKIYFSTTFSFPSYTFNVIKPLTPCIVLAGWLALFFLLSTTRTIAQVKGKGQLFVEVIDELTAQPTPVRVKITHKGFALAALPEETAALTYGLWDHADGFGFLPDSAFYVEGRFQLDLPPGMYEITLSKGNEYLSQNHQFRIEGDKTCKETFVLKRWINTPQMGWYSGDGHIHIRRSPKDNALLASWIQAEDVHVGVMLRMGDFWEIYYPQYAWGEAGVYMQQDYMFVSGQEDPRTPELGHVLSLGASDRVRLKEQYYHYDSVLDSLKSLGGLTGYAHGGETYNGYRGLMLDALRKKVDYLEILQYCISGEPLMVKHYYHLLDMGIPLTAVAGSDFPWCGKDHSEGKPETSSQIGNVRFYTHTEGELNYETWKKGLSQGNTFVSNGPVIDFKVNNQLPGSKIELKKSSKLSINAQAFGHSLQVPLQALEIIGHGKVLARVEAKDLQRGKEQLTLELNLPVREGIWLAARCYGEKGMVAHTTPVYVSVNGKGFHNPITLSDNITLSQSYLAELESALDNKTYDAEYQLWRYRSGLLLRIQEARQVLNELKKLSR